MHRNAKELGLDAEIETDYLFEEKKNGHIKFRWKKLLGIHCKIYK